MQQPSHSEQIQQHVGQLQKAIQQQKNKLMYFEQLEQQIKDISHSINRSPAAHNGQQSGAKPSDKQSRQTAAKSSNKKIKIYELQKKLKKLTAEFNEKDSAFECNKKKEDELLQEIEKTSKLIDKQKETRQSLIELELKIDGDIQKMTQKIIDQVSSLEQSVKRKEMFLFERTKIRDQLQRLHSVLDKDDPKFKVPSPAELSLSSSLHEEVQREQEQEQKYMSLESNEQWIIREKERLSHLFFKMEDHRQLNLSALHRFYQNKKQFSRQQTLTKHHRLTTVLQTSQLKHYQQIVKQSKRTIAQIELSSVSILQKVKKVEGERGYLRGKVGVTIEQLRLITGVNSLIEADIQYLQDKASYMRLLKGLFKQQQQ